MTVIDKVAWIHLDQGTVLSTRSKGEDVYYLPGGKREPGETDIDMLTREVREELTAHTDSPRQLAISERSLYKHTVSHRVSLSE